MSRLPTPGGDNGNWGNILNDFLEVSHNTDGTLIANVVDTTQIKDAAVTNAKLDSPTQTQLALGASAYQKPAGGIPESDLDSSTQTKIDAGGTAYQKPGTGIPKTDLASSVQTSLGSADTAVQSVNSKSGTSVTLTAADVGAVTQTTTDGLYAPIVTAGTAISASGALAVNTQSYCSAASGNLIMTLPTGQAAGKRILVTKSESSTNTVTITGNIQGIAAQSYVLSLIGQSVQFESDSSGSWWPISSRYDLSVLDNRYQLAGSAVGSSLAYSSLATGVGGFATNTTFVDIPGSPLTISPVLGTRAVEVQARLTIQPAAATTVSVGIYDATASAIVANAATNAVASGFVTVFTTIQVTPGAGTRTYRPQISTTSSTTCNVYGANVNAITSFIAAIQR